jgi:hypothetical protein
LLSFRALRDARMIVHFGVREGAEVERWIGTGME